MTLVFRDKGTSGTQFNVLSGDLRIGNIGKQVLSAVANHALQWGWDFSLHVGPPRFVFHGHADSLDDAKAAVERNWQAWLTSAGLAQWRKGVPRQGGRGAL